MLKKKIIMTSRFYNGAHKSFLKFCQFGAL